MAARTLAVLALLLLWPAAAEARRAAAAKDGRPNILVVMTDDQALTDVAKMPNVRRYLAAKGTSFSNAVDSFPLCCPSRATFITGQYAHNHGVLGNFHPFGWYGMKRRGNILPAWLQRSGYRTALIGKWLNGYGARDAHGEVPKGFDIWRGLLDVSAYDYFNFVMNLNGRLKSWGDADFARKLVKFAKIEVIPDPGGLEGVLKQLRAVFGPPPYKYWGAQKAADYSPDVTGKVTEDLVRRERRSKKPFFIWWAPAAPHREDVATTLMRRPGRDPRPAPRYSARSKRFRLPRPRSFNEADLSDKPSTLRKAAPPLTSEQIDQLQLDYEGRIGSLLAVDDHVKHLVKILKATGQMKNTTIVFTSDNGWMQGEHRIPGDKFLPYEESVKVPFIVRGPGVRANKTVRGQVSNIDFAPTLRGYREGARRPQAGRRVIDADAEAFAQAARAGDQARGATPALRGQHPDQRLGSALRGGADRALHLRGLHRDPRAGALRPAQRPVTDAQRGGLPGICPDQGAPPETARPAGPLPRPRLQRQSVRSTGSREY